MKVTIKRLGKSTEISFSLEEVVKKRTMKFHYDFKEDRGEMYVPRVIGCVRPEIGEILQQDIAYTNGKSEPGLFQIIGRWGDYTSRGVKIQFLGLRGDIYEAIAKKLSTKESIKFFKRMCSSEYVVQLATLSCKEELNTHLERSFAIEKGKLDEIIRKRVAKLI